MLSKRLTPPQLLVAGFAAVILIGAVLLTTPWAVKNGSGQFLTSLFTSTSAVCVTGLVVVDTGTHWTIGGQIVILFLMQIGGLGIMSFATFFALLLGKKIQLRERLLMQQALGKTSLEGIVAIFRYLLLFSFTIEFIAALIMAGNWAPVMGFGNALWFGLFHAVSAFNNCGMDLFGGFRSLTGYSLDVVTNLVISSLIVIGGLGFVVLYELYHYRQSHSLSVHTRIVLVTTAILISVGTFLILGLEYNHSLKDLPFYGKVMAAYFQSISPRTAGFNTIDLTAMIVPTQLVIIMLMFIGGSPGSTAGGVKTSTFALMWAAIISLLKGKKDTEIFRRRIPYNDVLTALSIIIMALSFIMLMAWLLSFTNHFSFLRLLFEVTSAMGTVGLSLGLTPHLDTWGRILIIVTMFVGRLGPLTIGYALAYREKQVDITYPEGKVMIG
ncbi:MAG TPA: TrkH family potassium uptake protein [Syntrophomonadaceae bacterium]|nr:TrkH family potassium uptake protein [Syntrophomonadaceae bacterium]